MGKKGNPNGIIEALFNIFIKPIVRVIIDLPFIPVDADVRNALKVTFAEIDLAKKKLHEWVTFDEPVIEKPTPQKVYETKRKIAFAINNDVKEMILHAAIMEAVPFVDVGGTFLAQMSRPDNRAMIDQAADVLLAPHTYVWKPMIQRHLFSQFTPLLPEAYRLALARSKGYLSEVAYTGAMKEQGYSVSWANIWRDQNYLYPPVELILALYRRGDLTDAEFNRWLERSSYPKESWSKVAGFKMVIPPISDLIHFAVREAYGAHTFEEQYPAYESWATKMGLTKEMTGWYWWAHWDRIDLQRMYDNLYRGYWDETKFMSYLRLKDIHPDDRQAILDVAWNPPTIREMGYGYDVGAYTWDDIYRFRTWGGLHPLDAAKAATAMIDYRVSAEREAVRREWLWLYAHGKITKEQFVAKLQELRTPAEAIPLWVTRGDLQVERLKKPDTDVEYAIPTSSEAKWAFEHGLKDETWLRDRLKDLDWDKSRIDLAVESSKQRIKEQLKPPIEAKYRDLTLTQIRDFYHAGMITDGDIPYLLMDIGYSEADAVALTELMLFVPRKVAERQMLSRTDVSRMYDMRIFTEKDVSRYFEKLGYSQEDALNLTLWTKISVDLPDLRDLYKNGWITSNQLVDGIKELGLPDERAIDYAMTILKYDSPLRMGAERDLTKSEILKGRKRGIISTNQAVELLTGIGYDEAEAYYLLALEDIIVMGDPEGYWQMKRVVELQKKAKGLSFKDIPQEVINLEILINQMKADIAKKREEGITAEDMAEEQKKIGNLEQKLRMVLITTKLEVM